MYSLLVVDDNNKDRRIVREMIEWGAIGIKIVGEATNGKSALKLLSERKTDIMITDISMPEMDGIRLAKEAKARHVGLDIIFMSYYEEFEYAKSAVELNVYGYILKPIRRDELLKTVNKILNIRNHKEKLTSKAADANLILEKDILRDLIFGSTNKNYEYNDKFSSINFSNTNIMQILCIRVNIHDVNRTESNPFAPEQSILDLLLAQGNDALVFRDKIAYALQTGINEYVLFMISENEATTMQHAVSLHNTLQKKVGASASIAIGISERAQFCDRAHLMYKQAQRAIDSKLFNPTMSVMQYNDSNYETRDAGIVREVKQIIKENYNKQISVEDIAKKIFLSCKHLNNIFKKETGKTVFDCLQEYRMMVAKELLSFPDARIYEVCEQVGYSNNSYFTLLFKNIHGQTPSEYRNSRNLKNTYT